MPSFLKPTFFIIVLLHQMFTSISESPYNPIDNILLSCGSPNGEVADDGRRWSGENDQNSPVLIEPSSKTSITETAHQQGSTAKGAPYMTARISRSQFAYTFSVTPGQKFIRLHFYPTNYGEFSRTKDFFDVNVGNYTLLGNFSASGYADLWTSNTLITETFVLEYCVNVEENQRNLNLSFAPFSGDSHDTYVFINGIEVVSMPTNLYYAPSDGAGHVQNDTVLEKVCRLNVGGLSISPVSDTGMFRSWTDDNIYFYPTSSDEVEPRYTSFTLNHSKVPTYSAPEDVYRSGRSMGKNGTQNMLNNLTWIVPVDHGFEYLVRLHFCEFAEFVTKINDRRFMIVIDNRIVDPGFDIIESSGGVLIPIYKDYTAKVGNREKVENYWINITLHPNSSSVQKDAFLNGIEVFKLSDSNGSLVTAMPTRPSPPPVPPLPPPPPQPTNVKKKFIITVCGSILGLLLLPLVSFFLLVLLVQKRKKFDSYHQSLVYCLCLRKGDTPSSTRDSLLPDKLCRYFSLDEIRAATRNFDEKLLIGVGGFGNVYRGAINEGVPVAIKRLNPMSKQGAREFNTEIEMLSQLRHGHLVSLIGYCNEEDEKILVYEYMVNGTLREHLYGADKDPLAWNRRLEICIGAASGLSYLHTGIMHPIIHRDVKTTNILLDEKYEAKVSDFGLSKIGLSDSAVSTAVKGTFGYLDPEYARCSQLTEKSDVYSFGVVLFEVLCARKVLDQRLDEDQRSLAMWARKCIENGTIHQIIDPYIMGKIAQECFNKFVEVAESCVRQQGSERPTMQDIMENLEFALELQNAADAKIKKMNPADEVAYPEVSFCAPKTDQSIIEGSESDSSDEIDQISFDTVQFTTKTGTTSSTFTYSSSSTSTA